MARRGRDVFFRERAVLRFGVPLPSVRTDDEAALELLRDLVGDEVADLAVSMPRESTMTE